MTPAQRLRLEKLGNKLCEAALEEMDPELLPGAGLNPDELTKEQRGNRFWTLKNTRAMLALVSDIEQLLGLERGALAALDEEPRIPSKSEVDKMIADAEREVERIRKGTRPA